MRNREGNWIRCKHLDESERLENSRFKRKEGGSLLSQIRNPIPTREEKGKSFKKLKDRKSLVVNTQRTAMPGDHMETGSRLRWVNDVCCSQRWNGLYLFLFFNTLSTNSYFSLIQSNKESDLQAKWLPQFTDFNIVLGYRTAFTLWRLQQSHLAQERMATINHEDDSIFTKIPRF